MVHRHGVSERRIRDLARKEIRASDKWRELFGFTPSEPLDLESILQRLHPDDREVLQQVLAQALAGGGSYETEFLEINPTYVASVDDDEISCRSVGSFALVLVRGDVLWAP